MSIEVLRWVMKYSDAQKGDRLVLFHLGWTANDDGAGCWPSVETMRVTSRLKSRSGVQNCLNSLKKAGRIVPVGTHSSGTMIYEVAGPFNPRYTAPEELEDGGPEIGQGAQKPGGGRGPNSDGEGPIFRDEGAHHTGQGGPTTLGTKDPEPTDERSKEPSGARARALAQVSVPPGLTPVLEHLERVREAKDGKLKLEAAVKACRDFADRDLDAEADDFEHYWLHGKGENVARVDIARTWRRWLRSAPSKAARARQPRRSHGEQRRQRVHELMQQADEQEARSA